MYTGWRVTVEPKKQQTNLRLRSYAVEFVLLYRTPEKPHSRCFETAECSVGINNGNRVFVEDAEDSHSSVVDVLKTRMVRLLPSVRIPKSPFFTITTSAQQQVITTSAHKSCWTVLPSLCRAHAQRTTHYAHKQFRDKISECRSYCFQTLWWNEKNAFV